MVKWIVSLLAISGAAQSNMINIQRSDIDYYQGQIVVDYRLTLSANPQKVKDLLNDFGNFHQISRLISQSHISHEKNNKTILHQELKPCLLGICYALRKEQQLFRNQNGSISAVFTPKQRYFDSGFEQWNVTSNDLGTTIEYTANVTPSFAVPPFIGTWLIRKFINDEINTVAKQIVKKCT